MCNHEDGWILIDEIVVNTKFDNDNFKARFVCNHLGCKERKVMTFDICNLEEV